MKQQIKNYFSFTKSERVGIIILISIVILLVLLPRFYEGRKEPLSDDLVFKAEVDKYIQSAKDQQKEELKTYNSRTDESFTPKSKRYTPFPFDPNNATLNEWVRMGFSVRQAEVILKYRNKGGHFNKKEDFKKLFIIDDETYSVFEPFISISDDEGPEISEINETNSVSSLKEVRSKQPTVTTGKKVIIEINAADSLELLKIKGIGPVFASRILKYRNRLGGFYNVNQLLEIYGFDSTRLAEVGSQIAIDSIKIKKILINKAGLSDLRKHPYLDYYTAKALIDKRIQSGGFAGYKMIKAVLDRKKGLYNKLRPYISLD